jgi:cell division protein FtsB
MPRGRKLLLVLSLAGSAIILLHTFVAADGWRRRTRVRRDLEALSAEISGMQHTALELRSQIEALRERSAVQEHVIRDELGYVRPGDVVVDTAAAAHR